MELGDMLVRDPEQFKERCKEREHQTTIAYFGLDLMITKEGAIRCIEINGHNSGTKGFKEAYGEDFARKGVIKYLASFGLPVTIYTYDADEKNDRWAEESLDVKVFDIEKVNLECSKEALSLFEFTKTKDLAQFVASWWTMSDESYYKRRASLSSEEVSSFEDIFRRLLAGRMGLRWTADSLGGLHSISQAEGIIWANNGIHFVFDEEKYLVVNPSLIEFATENKLVSEILMAPYSFPSCPVFPDQLEAGNKMLAKYLNIVRSPKIILKPNNGACGNGVVVLDKRKLLNSAGEMRKEVSYYLEEPGVWFEDKKIIKGSEVLRKSERILVQPFIESKPFYSAQTGKNHHGSIRYVAMVRSEGGNISVHHIGGYVRLAPEPIGDSMDACVANLARGAHAVPLSERDKNRLELWVDYALPHFYRRALRLAACPPEAPVNNCAFVEKFDRFYKSPWTWYQHNEIDGY